MNGSWLKVLNLPITIAILLGSSAYAVNVSNTVPNDSRIIKIVIAANNEEINTSQLVLKNSNYTALKALATGMIKDHSKSNVEMKKLAKKLGVPLEKSGPSEAVKKEASTELTELEKLNGTKLSRGYINNLVADHEALLKTFDNTLLPNSKSTQLVALLKETRVVVQRHLTMAKQIQPTVDE
jgi:putative membrane protein